MNNNQKRQIRKSIDSIINTCRTMHDVHCEAVWIADEVAPTESKEAQRYATNYAAPLLVKAGN